MDIQLLDNQAWALRLKLFRLIQAEHKGHAVKYSTPNMRVKLHRVYAVADSRCLRRRSVLWDFLSVKHCSSFNTGILPNLFFLDGFAPSPRQSSGVLGEGKLL